MRTAVIVVSLIAAAVAEAPYHLPRPAPHQPSFHYQGAARQPAPQAHFSSSSGYNYQQPSIQPAFVPQPQQHYHQPAPQQHYHQPQPHFHPQPAPQPNFNSGYHYQQPSIQPAFVQPQPQQVYQPAPQPSIPSTSYGVPQPQVARPLPQPVYIPQPQAPVQVYQPVFQQQQSSQQGYAYSQPAPQFQQSAPQFVQSAQSFSSGAGSGLSSYQADSAQYSGSQGVHSEALDSVVLNRVQNIIRESEHSSARDAGYQSLVSGVSLESARPSVELSSFVQTGPVSSGGASFSSQGSSVQGSGSAESLAVSAPSGSYLPSISANSQSSGSGSSSISFLPSSKPATAYGLPN